MKKLRISKIWIAVIVVAVISIAAWALSGGKEKEEINFKQDQVALKTLQNSVTATGTIEAVTSVTVGTQVSGIVSKLYVDYNTQVKEGTEKVPFFYDQNGKCLRFVTSLSANRLK